MIYIPDILCCPQGFISSKNYIFSNHFISYFSIIHNHMNTGLKMISHCFVCHLTQAFEEYPTKWGLWQMQDSCVVIIYVCSILRFVSASWQTGWYKLIDVSVSHRKLVIRLLVSLNMDPAEGWVKCVRLLNWPQKWCLPPFTDQSMIMNHIR